jgi:hypothetical protein
MKPTNFFPCKKAYVKTKKAGFFSKISRNLSKVGTGTVKNSYGSATLNNLRCHVHKPYRYVLLSVVCDNSTWQNAHSR